MADDNVLHQVKRDAVQEARTGDSRVATGGAGRGSGVGQATPSSFRLGTSSLVPFCLDEDELPAAGEEATAKAYLW